MKGHSWPINGASKARRLAWSTPPNQISWAFMKLLREGNKTMKVYEVNPYVEVFQFYDNLYGLYNQSCDGGGDVWSWLVVGPQKAMLIDTAFGLGDTKGLVDEITGGLPLIVVNTCAGTEHILGNCRFEKVYCHEYDYEAIKSTCKAGAWDYLFDKSGNNIWLQFDKKDLPTYKNFDLVAVRDGASFNLGGNYEVELVWTGGHTPGHSMLIDKKRRYLFAGDGVSSDIISFGGGSAIGKTADQYANLTTYRDNLTKLVGRIDEYDYMFPGHFMVNLENNVLVSVLSTLNAIIAAPDSFSYKAEDATGSGVKQEKMHKYINGFSTIAYTQANINPPKK